MAIYAFGAYYDTDVSQNFIDNNVVGTGWDEKDAPELFQYIKSLKVGDIVYIKSFSPASPDIFIKAIGIISDSEFVQNEKGVKCGRNVVWKYKKTIRIAKPVEKNNVRANTMYEEFHPEIQSLILSKL